MQLLRRAQQLTRVGLITLSGGSSADKQRRIIEQLVSMGSVYVKFAQLLLLKLNSASGGQDYSFLLKKTYDATPTEPLEIRQLLLSELGAQANQLNNVNPVPIASGSFGQVYSAQLAQDGTAVIIKAMKPSVLKGIRLDLMLLKLFITVMNIGYDGKLDLRQLFSEFKTVVLRELDYESEVFYASSLHAKYRHHPSLVIPKTHESLCSQHLIVQDYVQGLPLTDVLVARHAGYDASIYTQQQLGSSLSYQMSVIGQEMLSSLLEGSLTHGDPHPGNIILLPNNQVALIDFGICTTGPANKHAFFKLVQEYEKIYTKDEFNVTNFTHIGLELFVSDLTNAMRSLDLYTNGETSKKILAGITHGVESIYSSSLHDIDSLIENKKFMQIFNTVINENNRFGLQITIDHPEFIRATLLYISLMESLAIKQDVLRTVYGNVVTAFQGCTLPNTTQTTAPERAITVLAEWLEQIARRDAFLYMLVSKKLDKEALYV
jgi:predicted unusual protein kinase regulating ubiquinone biosynthesis (AarF/ABC1/UbiB family)